MKNKILVKMFLIGIFAAMSAVFSNAQEGATTFKDGYTVAVKTEKRPSDNNRSSDYIRTVETSSGYAINRLIIDETNKIYYGYDYKVIREDKTNKFRISFAPLSVNPKTLFNTEGFTAKTLPAYPADIVVEDGDSVTLDILENPQTGAKVSDIIKVTSKPNKFGSYFAEREKAKDFTIDDVQLRLDAPEVLINGEKSKIGGSASGNIIYVALYGKGRFIFSFVPQPGYNFQKNGVILDNKIMFDYNGESYQFINKSPVLGSGGKWNLWVMFDPDYKPTYQLSPNSPYEVGTADKLEYLFQKKFQ
ncbi:hypothetical protein BH20ACI1_BH20ACI1_02530 [soil metagenome]